jgi:hypothetical protein
VLDHLAGSRLVGQVDVRASGYRVEALEHVLLDERLALDEVDPARGPLEKIEVAVTADVDQPGDRPAVAPEIHENRRRDLVPVPGLVRLVLEVTFYLSRRGIDRDGRGGV